MYSGGTLDMCIYATRLVVARFVARVFACLAAVCLLSL